MDSNANLITKERTQSFEYDLKTINYNGKEIVELTPQNVAKVEAMIRNDSKYTNAAREDNKEASPYWIIEMKKYLDDENYKGSSSFEEVVEKVVVYLDQENKTHLNSDKVGRGEMKNRIVNCRKDLIEYLKKSNGTELIHILSRKTDALKKARCNPSFASKFCHFCCFYMFKNQLEQDNFSIYDSIVKKTLPFYMKYYGLKKKTQKDLCDYNTYQETIDKIIQASGGKISRNGFDHLIWYFFKGRQPPKKKRQQSKKYGDSDSVKKN